MKRFSYSTQLTMLINIKMPTTGILTFISMINTTSDRLKARKVSKGAKIRNRYNQVPHLTQNTNGKVTNSQLDTTNESQEVSPFPAKVFIFQHF